MVDFIPLSPKIPENSKDVVWELEALTPQSPKRDGSAETYLREIGRTPDDYVCNSLFVCAKDERGECLVCKQKAKTVQYCRINRSNTFSDIPICTDCINVFIEYNPKAVFNLEPKTE